MLRFASSLVGTLGVLLSWRSALAQEITVGESIIEKTQVKNGKETKEPFLTVAALGKCEQARMVKITVEIRKVVTEDGTELSNELLGSNTASRVGTQVRVQVEVPEPKECTMKKEELTEKREETVKGKKIEHIKITKIIAKVTLVCYQKEGAPKTFDICPRGTDVLDSVDKVPAPS